MVGDKVVRDDVVIGEDVTMDMLSSSPKVPLEQMPPSDGLESSEAKSGAASGHTPPSTGGLVPSCTLGATPVPRVRKVRKLIV